MNEENIEQTKLSLKDAIKLMVDAYKTFNDAKDDCKDRVDSAWEALEGDIQLSSANITQKEVMKIAKSIANNKIRDFEEEHEKLGILLEKTVGKQLISDEDL